MEVKLENASSKNMRKAGLLLVKAADLGMKTSGHGCLGVNPNSGNTYLWLEDYSFTLFIGLYADTVKACWTDPENGDEEYAEAEDMTLEELNAWVEELEEAVVTRNKCEDVTENETDDE